MSRLFLFSCFTGLFALAAAGHAVAETSDPDARFLSGNRAYEDGRYDDAERVYRQLADDGMVSAELFFNLGNAVYRRDRPGEAALWYRRALVMDPRFAEARQNLRAIKNKTGYHEFELSGVNAWLSRFTSGELIALISVGFWIAALLLTAAFLYPRLREWRPLLFIVSGIGAVIGGGAIWGLVRQADQVSADDLAIVIGNDAAAVVGPVPDAEKVVDLPPGSELKILQRRGPWTYIGIPQDLRGWVRSEAIAPVLWYGPHAVPDAEPSIAASGPPQP